MTRIEAIRAFLAEEEEDEFEYLCSPYSKSPGLKTQDLRDFLKLYDATKEYVTGGDDVTITKILMVLSALDSPVGDEGADRG